MNICLILLTSIKGDIWSQLHIWHSIDHFINHFTLQVLSFSIYHSNCYPLVFYRSVFKNRSQQKLLRVAVMSVILPLAYGGIDKKNIIGSLGWILRCINVLYCTNLCKDVFSFRLSDHDFVYPTTMQNIFHRNCALYCAILLYSYIVR